MKKYIGLVGLYAFPLLVLAQSNPFVNILGRVRDILNLVVPVVITIALIYFIWGVARYIITDDEDKKKAARDVMVYGAIGLFFIVSIWGIVGLLQDFTGARDTTIDVPGVPGTGTNIPN